MKKRCMLISVLVLAMLLCGCDKVIGLSDAEEAAIAEYAAELLLKYDKFYETKFIEGEELSMTTEAEPDEDDTEVSTEATTEASTEASTDISTEQNSEDNSTEEGTDTTTEASTEPIVEGETDIAKILGIAGVSTTYNNYQICERYPAMDKNGEFMYLEATNGMKLIVVEFDMTNTTDAPVDIDLLNVDVKYSIVMNQSKAAKSMLTILMDDLSTYQGTLAPTTTQKAVLVFQIADNLVSQVRVLQVRVLYNGSENYITLT